PWLAGRGAEHRRLVSRRGPEADGADALVAAARAAGATVDLVAADIADKDAARGLLERVPAQHPLDAVFHAAGVLDDTVLSGLTPERAETVLRVKVGGAANLDELTRGAGLSAFVLFSSFAPVVGGLGLGNYAPGNSMLEILAARRRSAGDAATAIAWSRWSGDGLAARTRAARLGRNPRRRPVGRDQARLHCAGRRRRGLGAVRARLYRGAPEPAARRIARRRPRPPGRRYGRGGDRDAGKGQGSPAGA